MAGPLRDALEANGARTEIISAPDDAAQQQRQADLLILTGLPRDDADQGWVQLGCTLDVPIFAIGAERCEPRRLAGVHVERVFVHDVGPGEIARIAGTTMWRRRLQRKVGLLGNSPGIREILNQAIRVAPTDSTVLITGETGTGKELLARFIHAGSRRAKERFVAVNVGGLTDTLVDSELVNGESCDGGGS